MNFELYNSTIQILKNKIKYELIWVGFKPAINLTNPPRL